ncbi:MAG TPA: type II toxin-antitoxin system PemK/MazF family toxin [Gammaproteobacteria bacterium]|nr:type II toxin-antitoxin system PemK/MazF family toxin [Gammaproteobacteria bacterium]
MKRGDLVPVTLPGAYGKLRPALVIQSDFFDEHPSVTVLPVTSKLRQAPLVRLALEPTPDNGLKKSSQIMIDKLHTLPRDKVGSVFGQIDNTTLVAINRHLALFLGIA